MHLMKMASRWMAKTSPLGLILTGTAVLAAAPILKDVARGVAVTATRGVLSIAEGAAALGSDVKEGWEDLVAEAKSQNPATAMAGIESGTVVGAGAGGALGATVGGSMAGAMGATVGGGLGSVVGAGVGSSMTEGQTKPPVEAQPIKVPEKELKKTVKKEQ